MSTNNKEKKELALNKSYFSFLERLILRISLPMLKRIIAKRAIKLAVWSSTGYYSSPVIERVFLDQAESIPCDYSTYYDKDSTIHIMTECYGVGGHSKVVERWIYLTSDLEKHSVVFVNQKESDIPKIFLELCSKSGGSVYSLKAIRGENEKAKKLRQLASVYERVILHTHMYDVIPLIAFGTSSFKRPVILYNHADHLFWLGVSIADKVAETRSWGQSFTLERRRVENSLVLSIPPNIELKRVSERVAFENNSKFLNILTVGTSHKYTSLDGNSFPHYMKLLLDKYSNLTFSVVGPQPSDFSSALKGGDKHMSRVRFLGCIPNEQLNVEMQRADLVIDSFPMSGGTALGEAIAIGTPVLALKSVTGHLDYMYESESYCSDFSQLLSKTERFICDKNYRYYLSTNVGSLYQASENTDKWLERLNNIYKSLPSEHQVYERSEPSFNGFNDLDRFLLMSSQRKKLLFEFGKIFSLYYYRKRGCLRLSIRLFR